MTNAHSAPISAIIEAIAALNDLSLADISEDTTKIHNNLLELRYYSPPLFLFIPAVAADQNLNSVVIPSLTNRTILEAFAGVNIHTIEEDSAGENCIADDQYIKIDNSAEGEFYNAIQVLGGALAVDADGNRAGCEIIGSIDISSYFTWGDTVYFKWANSKAAGADLLLTPIQSFIILHVL